MSEEAKELGQESAFPNQYYDGDELWCDEKRLNQARIYCNEYSRWLGK